MQIGLNNNQLKLLALLSMTLDHIGVALLPQCQWLRLAGRLAFPIFAFMIAEGCRHTRSMGRYLGTMAAVAAVCQLAYFFAMGSLYMCIMVTFTLSAAMIWLVKKAQEGKNPLWGAGCAVAAVGIFFLTEVLPLLSTGTDLYVDYGFLGVMLPVAVYLFRGRALQLLATAAVLAAMSLGGWWGQWVSLLALPLLALYNGRRGKWRLKWLFYIYYPAHLLAIQGVALLLGK